MVGHAGTDDEVERLVFVRNFKDAAVAELHIIEAGELPALAGGVQHVIVDIDADSLRDTGPSQRDNIPPLPAARIKTGLALEPRYGEQTPLLETVVEQANTVLELCVRILPE